MRYPRFLAFNLIGAAHWAIGLPLSGFFLGNLIPDIDRYLLPIVGLIVLLDRADRDSPLARKRR